MQEHLTEQQIEAYRQRALAPGARLTLDRHLAACAACLRRVVDPEHVDLAFTSLKESFLTPPDEEPFHLSHEELASYATGRVDEVDRTIFESHLADCTRCSQAATRLAHVNSDLIMKQPAELPHRARPSIAAGVAAYWRTLARPRLAYVAGFILALISAALLLFSLQSNRRTEDQAQSAPAGKHDQDQARTASPTQPDPAPTQAQGEPATQSAGANATGPLAPKTSLPPRRVPSQITPANVVSLYDGDQQVTLDQRGRLSGLAGVSEPIQQAVKKALATHELVRPAALDELAAQRITLLNEGADAVPFALSAPVGVVTLAERPTFHWRPLAGADSYTVAVFDADFNRVVQSAPQATTNWSSPVALARGRIYFWQVTATRAGQEIVSPVAPAPRARFKVVDADKAREIEQTQRTRPGSHLVLGILYADAGLLAEAERELQSLVNANPRSQVALKLLRQVRSWQRAR